VDVELGRSVGGAGLTVGTDSRNQNAAHFYYCYQMAQVPADRSRHVCAQEEVGWGFDSVGFPVCIIIRD
jgi:hypothetical protein